MKERDQTPICRSKQEQEYYLLVRVCVKCGAGPLEELRRESLAGPAGDIDKVRARCAACGQEEELTFVRPSNLSRTGRSTLIDVAEWLGLCHHFLDLAQTSNDEQETHQRIVSARFCLNEALKFYPSDSNLPPPEAFFGRLGGQRYREHPTAFLKTKLVELRGRMGSLEPGGKKRSTSGVRKRKYWRAD